MRFLAPVGLVGLLAAAACNVGDDAVASDTSNFSGVVAPVDAADAPGAFDVEEHEYALAPTADDGVVQPADGQPATVVTQVAGRLYLPKVAGPRPVIVLLHGNHPTCGFFAADADRAKDPRIDLDITYTEKGECLPGWEVAKSYLGYSYVAHHLATHGFVVVSVDANRGVTGGPSPNDRDANLIEARGRLVLRNLELFTSWNESAAGTAIVDGVDMRGRFDLSQIGMMGHSRGGEGVRAAYNIYLRDLFPDLFHWKTKKPTLGFRAIFEIGSVDFGHPADRGAQAAFYDAPGLAWNALIPGCDGDVSDFEGVNSYTRMLQSGGTAPRSVVVAWGGNHNFFNTEWQTSDAPACRGSQKALFDAAVQKNFTTAASPPEGCDATCWSNYQAQATQPYGVNGSSKQRDVSRILMTSFFEAHLGAGNTTSAQVFDPKFDLPARLNDIAPLWRDFVSPDSTGSAWPPNAILTKVSDVANVTVLPVDTVLQNSINDAVRKITPQLPPGTQIGAAQVRTKDAVSLQWARTADTSAPTPHAAIALPPQPTDTAAEYIQLVVSNMPQSTPCIAASPNPSCTGDGTPLDFNVRLVNDDGTTSDTHRMSEFGSLVPYLRSNIVGVSCYRETATSTPSCYLNLNEPVFDTVVLPLKDFAVGGQPFPVSASTKLRIDFDAATDGTLSFRNVRLLGKIAAPVTAARH